MTVRDLTVGQMRQSRKHDAQAGVQVDSATLADLDLVVLFLGVMANTDKERALAVSFVVLSISLVVAAIGGVTHIVFRPPTQDKIKVIAG